MRPFFKANSTARMPRSLIPASLSCVAGLLKNVTISPPKDVSKRGGRSFSAIAPFTIFPMPRPQASTSPQRKKALAIAKELNLNRKRVQRVLRKYAEAIAAEDPDEALLEALAETPKDATSIANTLKNEYIRGNTT